MRARAGQCRASKISVTLSQGRPVIFGSVGRVEATVRHNSIRGDKMPWPT